ncbi:MAG: sulfotransferase [Pirellula staleyi]
MIRKYLRDKWFRLFLRSAFHAEGKFAIAESLRGLLTANEHVVSTINNVAAPYTELEGSFFGQRPFQKPNCVIITGRFRSGSTMLWNVFRQLDDVTAFYEPLNERRWFDASHRGDSVDRTHRGVTNYWREYEGLEELSELYQEDWTRNQLYMDERSWEPQLKQYIERLVESSQGTAVLQFNRIDFRLAWIVKSFPGVQIVHLMRHPRDQWCSTLGCPSSFGPNDGDLADFSRCDNYYLNTWVADLRYRFPFLADESKQHPYRCFYLLWKMSYLFARRYADILLRFEDVIAQPRMVLQETFDALNLSSPNWVNVEALIKAPEIGRWKTYAANDWFRDHELHCEQVLNEYLGTFVSDKCCLEKAASASRSEERVFE